MNHTDATALIALAASYDPRIMPADDTRAALKANEWAHQLDGYQRDQIARIIREHYASSDDTITIARIKARALYLAAAIARKARSKQLATTDTGPLPPPADLLDRTRPCPTCNAEPSHQCTPAMPFGINHIYRNPITIARHDHHTEYDQWVAAGHDGVICECCGEHTRNPA